MIDESGEDYLYSKYAFVRAELSQLVHYALILPMPRRPTSLRAVAEMGLLIVPLTARAPEPRGEALTCFD